LPSIAFTSSAHTYRLLFVKEPVPPGTIKSSSWHRAANRFVRQQQRNEIMQHFQFRVKHLSSLNTFTSHRNCFI
jgi:hypothetical protein